MVVDVDADVHVHVHVHVYVHVYVRVHVRVHVHVHVHVHAGDLLASRRAAHREVEPHAVARVQGVGPDVQIVLERRLADEAGFGQVAGFEARIKRQRCRCLHHRRPDKSRIARDSACSSELLSANAHAPNWQHLGGL